MATINKINVSSTDYDIKGSLLYGVCETAADTVAKTVTVDGTFTLYTGATVAVKFKYTNSASNPTLNVNSTGAKAIKRYGTTAAGTAAYTSWSANQVVIFVYDGTQWQKTYNEVYNGDITGVTAGDGLTGGKSSGAVTVAVGAGTGISVSADAVNVKLQSDTPYDYSATPHTDTFASIVSRPIEVDKDGNLSVRVNDSCLAYANAPMELTGRLVDSQGATDLKMLTNVVIEGTGEKGRLIKNAQIHPDAREFCFVDVTFTESNSTMVGTGTIKGLTNYYPGLTIAAYLDGYFTYANSITLNLNSLGSKTVRGLDKSIVAGHVVLLTYTEAGIWRVVRAQASADEKVKQYDIKVENDLENGEVAWTGTFPLLTLYNRDSSTFTGETAYTSNYYIEPLTNGLVVPRLTTDALNAPEATSQNRGLMSAADKAKLDVLPTLEDGKIPNSYLPSYVDDVIEGTLTNSTTFTPADSKAIVKVSDKIYVDTSNNKTYRWGGTAYVEISPSLAIGTTASTAAKGNHTHSASYTPAGSISATFAGTSSGHTHTLSGSFTSGTNSGTAVTASTSSHKHSVTAAGTVGANTSGVSVASALHTHSMPQLLFTGTSASHTHSFGATTSGAPSATVKVGSETHTHTIPALTFTGSSATSDGPSSKVVAATLTSSVANQRLTLNFAAQTVAGGAHTHNVTAAGSVASSTTGAPSATTSVGSSAHTHTTAAATTGSASHTPSGTITVGSGDYIGQSGPMGALEGNTIEVATKDHAHTFTGSAVTSGAATTSSGHTASVAPSGHTHSTTLSGNTGSTSVTPSGTVGATFTGTAATINTGAPK